jgi:hypothetical protein
LVASDLSSVAATLPLHPSCARHQDGQRRNWLTLPQTAVAISHFDKATGFNAGPVRMATESWVDSNRSLRRNQSVVHTCVFQRDSRRHRRRRRHCPAIAPDARLRPSLIKCSRSMPMSSKTTHAPILINQSTSSPIGVRAVQAR